MPEGDTIFRAARTLDLALGGRPVSRFETVLPKLARVDDDTPLAGQVVKQVSSRGKHLLTEFSGGLVLRTHMRMSGSWHIYRPGEKWRRTRGDMRIMVETPEFIAVAFNITVAEFVNPTDLRRHRELGRIGPGNPQLEQILAAARRLMLMNVNEGSGRGIVTYVGFRRTTRRADPAERLWVYGRKGKPCRQGGTAMERRVQGEHARTTYWCPRCQPSV